jgi:hypothetical protein
MGILKFLSIPFFWNRLSLIGPIPFENNVSDPGEGWGLGLEWGTVDERGAIF